LKDLDKRAYDIVCNWYKAIGFNPIYNGVDYSQIIRFYLWDKVGRAIRIENNIDFGEVKAYKKEYQSFPFYYTPLISKGQFKKSLLSQKKLIFIPFHVPHTAKLVGKLKDEKFRILSKELTPQITSKEVVKHMEPSLDIEWYNKFSKAVFKGIEKFGVSLIKEDIELLEEQIKGSILITDLAFKEFKKYKPDALYVHSDNHPVYINYVLVAKKLGIPTFTYQHGLDCEHYYLDDCFADYVAVWSENRKKAYQLQSKLKPKAIEVVGNMFLDNVVSNKKNKDEQTILFITRPHKSIKCYSPSRNHLEGVEILKTILEFMAINNDTKLIIKPHPMDNYLLYEECIFGSGMEARIKITNENLQNIFPKVNLIVTEDSTAGAESMFYKLPCIHAHLAKTEPVLPLVKYGSALPGNTKDKLKESLISSFKLSKKEYEKMKKGQEYFIKDFLPLGNLTDLVNFIMKNI
jgi:UDP-N-acetylglucosamine 2-epimerase